LLCLLCFFGFCYRGRDKQESAASPRRQIEQLGNKVGKGYGQMEPSTNPSVAEAGAEESKTATDQEVEMAEVHTGEVVTA